MIGCEWFREFQYCSHRHDELSFNYGGVVTLANGTINRSKFLIPSPCFSLRDLQRKLAYQVEPVFLPNMPDTGVELY
jgi:hypothetical protein